MEWMHEVWLCMRDGLPLDPDPFYPRDLNDYVDIVLGDMISELEYELHFSPGYHRKNQLIMADQELVIPAYLELPFSARLAIVQGIDRIMREYEWTEADSSAEAYEIAQRNSAEPVLYTYDYSFI